MLNEFLLCFSTRHSLSFVVGFLIKMKWFENKKLWACFKKRLARFFQLLAFHPSKSKKKKPRRWFSFLPSHELWVKNMIQWVYEFPPNTAWVPFLFCSTFSRPNSPPKDFLIFFGADIHLCMHALHCQWYTPAPRLVDGSKNLILNTTRFESHFITSAYWFRLVSYFFPLSPHSFVRF